MAGFTGASPIVTDGLVFAVDAANYESYSGSGTTWTDLAGSNNGTLSGTTHGPANGGVFVFDGTDDIIQFSNEIINPNSDFTFESWIRPSDVTLTGTIVSDKDNIGSLQIRFWSSGATIQIVDSYQANVGAFTNFTAINNTWYNVTIVFTNSQFKVYVNGGSATITNHTKSLSDITTSNGFVIANISDSNRPFEGNIALTQIYNKALSAAEVLQNYNSLKSRFNL